MFYKKIVLKNFVILTGKYLYWSLFWTKLQAWRPATFLKNRHQHRCFPVNTAKFLRTPILKKTCERLLLEYFEKVKHFLVTNWLLEMKNQLLELTNYSFIYDQQFLSSFVIKLSLKVSHCQKLVKHLQRHKYLEVHLRWGFLGENS